MFRTLFLIAAVVIVGCTPGSRGYRLLYGDGPPTYPSAPPVQTLTIAGSDGTWTLEIHMQGCEIFPGTLTNHGQRALGGPFHLMFLNRAENRTLAEAFYFCATALPGGTSSCSAALPAYNCTGADYVLVKAPLASPY